MRKIKIALYQSRLKGFLPKKVLQKIKRSQVDFLVLPEYFFIRRVEKLSQLARDEEKNRDYLKKISSFLPQTILIGGSFIVKEGENYYNVCDIFFQGNPIGRYRKQKLFGREIGDITSGKETQVFYEKNIYFSVLICADVLENSHFEQIKKQKPHFIFVPTFSPYKEESVKDKIERDERIFSYWAKELNCYIIKVCGVNSSHLSMKIQGRSLIASPSHIIWRTPFHKEECEILKITTLPILE